MKRNFWIRNTIVALLGTAMSMGGTSLYAQQSRQDSSQRNRSQQDWQADDENDDSDWCEESERSDSDRSRQNQNWNRNEGQNQNQTDGRDRRSSDRMRSDNSRRGQSNGDGQRQQMRDQSATLRLDPRAWVTIGTDYDNDGNFDAFERIYLFDLERARRDSSQRQNDVASRNGRQDDRRGQMTDGRSRDQRSDSRQHANLPRTESVRGTITRLASVKMSGADENSRLAKVQTQDGKQLTVCLGPKSKLSKLDLQRGDRVDIKGVKARLNDRPILMATQLKSGNQSVSTSLPDRVNLKRAKAELVSKRTVRFKNFEQPFVVGQVETKSGNRTLVNLGPAERVDRLQLEEGDSLKILARQGTINGQSAMIAEEIRANGKTIRLPRPQDREKFRRQNRNGNPAEDGTDREA